MSFIKRPMFAITVGMLGLAAVLGGSLGLAAAHTQSLANGFNLVGGPLAADTEPDDFMACIPANSWSSIYIWDAANQKWQHFFNPSNTPDYINAPEAGGIVTIKRLAGVVVLTTQAVDGAVFKDSPSSTC